MSAAAGKKKARWKQGLKCQNKKPLIFGLLQKV
jgi:hypothetical protein